ncbi:hypothetical protein [Photobacterium kishitanii]|uniref:Deoxynucleotide monophosphate kinase n=1 Tax=Photobacterium kishitanii TaxID=318456 RepID=A0A2T3KMF1_9GAMM|nr:hypothetical protein [Photobacterium kishitanii]PSV00976.1 hypothetical protein C9J27_02825 [Photobacterium kishitanii]
MLHKAESLNSTITELQRCDFSNIDRSSAELWITSVCVKKGLDKRETRCAIEHLLPAKKMPKFIVMGHKQHGKDSFCEYLRDNYGVTFASSSYTALEVFLFESIKGQFGYKTIDEAYEDRDNHRELYFNKISKFNEDNGLDTLGKIIFKNKDGYCGIRNRKEFVALKNANEFNISIWIDASERLEPENGSSNELTKNDADIVITNNTTRKDFQEKIERFYHLFAK